MLCVCAVRIVSIMCCLLCYFRVGFTGNEQAKSAGFMARVSSQRKHPKKKLLAGHSSRSSGVAVRFGSQVRVPLTVVGGGGGGGASTVSLSCII